MRYHSIRITRRIKITKQEYPTLIMYLFQVYASFVLMSFWRHNMMKSIIFLLTSFASLFCSEAIAQDYLGESREKIISIYKVLAIDNEGYFVYDISESEGSVSVVCTGEERTEYNYNFGYAGMCDQVLIKHSCYECLELNITNLLNERKKKWQPLSVDTFLLSRKLFEYESVPGKVFLIPEMHINRDSKEILLSLRKIDQKGFKELKKKKYVP